MSIETSTVRVGDLSAYLARPTTGSTSGMLLLPMVTGIGEQVRAWADELAERGWLLQVNASSLLGRHTPEMEREGWRLIDDGLAALIASDGHRATRPMLLDGAYELTRARVGEEQALRLFDGSALGLAAPTATGQPAESATR